IDANVDLHSRALPCIQRCAIINRSKNTRSENLLSALASIVSFCRRSWKTHMEQYDQRSSSHRSCGSATPSPSPLSPSERISSGMHVSSGNAQI
ncbi:hypothetical protein EDC04DRAFT_2578860, partial [Pisolithus marmoratus]